MHMHTQVQSVVQNNNVLANILVVRAEHLGLGRALVAVHGVHAVVVH